MTINLITTTYKTYTVFALAVALLVAPVSAFASDNNTVGGLVATADPVSSITKDSVKFEGYVNNTSGKNIDVWFEYATSFNRLYNGGQSASAKRTARPDTTPRIFVRGLEEGTEYFYRIIARSGGDIIKGDILKFTTTGVSSVQTTVYNGNNNNNNNSNNNTTQPIAVTELPLSVTTNSATLSGRSIPGNNTPTTGWFEWGPSQTLGFQTATKQLGNVSTNFSETVTGLTSNKVYFYRAVVETNGGVQFGSILSFRTGVIAVAPTPAVTTPTEASPVATNDNTSRDRSNGIGDNNLMAALFFGDDFFPNTFMGWILLIVMLFAVISLGNYVYGGYIKRLEEEEDRKKLAEKTSGTADNSLPPFLTTGK